MALNHGAKIVRDGLVLHLDAANVKSYPGSGTTWYDLSGRNLQATLRGTATISNGYMTINDTSKDYAEIEHDATISGEAFGTADTFTLISWCRVSSYVNWASLINKAFWTSWSNTTAGLWISNDIGIGFIMGTNESSNPAGSYIRTNFFGATDTWYQVVGVADGTNATLYINAEQKDQTAISGLTRPRSENTHSITIGRRSDGIGPSLDGDIAMVSVFNRALSPSEIKQNFNAFRGRYGI